MNFFVIGLPRSRTAWFANFLTYEDHFCFHEGMSGCHSVDEYLKKLGDDGDASTALMLLDMNEQFPEAPKVIIHRNIEISMDFMFENYGFFDRDYMYYLYERMKQIEGYHVDFEDINNELPGIWEYLIGTHYNEKRGDQLKDLRVEMMDPLDFDMNAIKALWEELNIMLPNRS